MHRAAHIRLAVALWAAHAALPARGDEADTYSPVVSYQFQETLATADPPASVISPVVSYQYFDWPGDENLTFESSANVSYFFDGVPEIAVGPASQVVQAGSNVVLNVQARGSTPLSYQWHLNGGAIPGAISATFARNNVQLADSGSYSVVVANANGSVESAAARLNVFLPPGTPKPPPPSLTLAAETPAGTLTSAPRTPSSAQLKVFNPGGQVDRTKMTVVLTHGWHSSSDGWPKDMKDAMLNKGYGSTANILAWDWRDDANTKSPSTAAARTRNQGDGLGAELFYLLGANYNKPIHFIGHSFGTILNCEAADYIHGDAKNSPTRLTGSSLKYRPENTHMTLFDEAELVQPIKGVHLFFDVLLKPQGDTTADLINNFWTKVIPRQFSWADNYLSEVGLLHPETANVLLWRSKYFPNQVVAQHGYAYEWYLNTVANPRGSAMGHRWSFERNSLDAAPDAPAYYLQSLVLAGSEFAVNPIPGAVAGPLSRGRLVAYPSLKAYQGLSAIGNTVTGIYLDGIEYAGNVVADVIESFAPLNGEPVYVGSAGSTPAYYSPSAPPTSFQAGWDYQFTLDNEGAPQPPDQLRFPAEAGASDADGGSSLFIIIPVGVPWDAVGMSFEFQFEGVLDANTYMTMGIGDENYFVMEAKFVDDGVWNNSTVIDISEYGGQDIEIFVGLNGDAAIGRVNVRGIQFYCPPPPVLGLSRSGSELTVSWPLSAFDWALEASDDLSVDRWWPQPDPPEVSDYFNTITFDISADPRVFFRLSK